MTGAETIAHGLAVMLARANGGTEDDAPTLHYDDGTGGWWFRIDTPFGAMRVEVGEDD